MYCNLYEKNVDLHNYPKAFKRLLGRILFIFTAIMVPHEIVSGTVDISNTT